MAAVIIAIGVVVVLAAIFLITTARRDRAEATGFLSRETKKRDRSRENPLLQEEEEAQPVSTGRAVERAAVLERRGANSGAGGPPPPPGRPAGRRRRHRSDRRRGLRGHPAPVLQPGRRRLHGAGPVRLR